MIEFLTLTLVAALMIISPGPDFAIVVQSSLTGGRLSGVYASIGVAFANLCHVAVNLLGIGLIISKSIIIFTLLKVFGAAYLIYLGYKGIRSKPGLQNSIHDINHALNNNSQSRLAGFRTGFLTSLLNPKACLFYLSFFSVMLSPNTPLNVQIFYGAWLSLMALFWFSLVTFFFTHPLIGRKLHACKHWIERTTGGILMLLGLKLLGTKVAI